MRVLIIEDNPKMAAAIQKGLQANGLAADVSHTGFDGEDLAAVEPYDVVLLDLMLPGLDGLEVCRRLRERMDVPVIVLTARTEEADRVLGLEGGADDYVLKPFSSRELLARVRAHARRHKGLVGPRANRIEVGPLVVDAATMSATLHGKPLALTTYELSLLRVLAERAGRVLGREQIMELVKGNADEAFDRSIDVHISRLRAKLGDDPRQPRLLKTVRGVGYVLSPSE